MTQIMILKRDAIENGTRTPPSEGGCAGWNVCMEGALWQTIKLTPPPSVRGVLSLPSSSPPGVRNSPVRICLHCRLGELLCLDREKPVALFLPFPPPPPPFLSIYQEGEKAPQTPPLRGGWVPSPAHK